MILLLNRSFYPDTEATGQFLTDLAGALATTFPITAVCGLSYSVPIEFGGILRHERHEGVKIIRVKHTRFSKESFVGRLANWFTYSAMAFYVCLKQRPRFLFVQTDPPVLGAMALLLRRFHRCKIVFNCRDLYPDVALELGIVRRGWVASLFESLNRRAFRESIVTVALGEDMANRIAAKGIPRDQILVIPDWVDTRAIVPVPRAQNEYVASLNLGSRFTIMYSGNIGLTQDFETLAQAIARMNIDRSRWVLLIAGGGAARKKVEEMLRGLGIDNVVYLPSQPREKLSSLLSAGTLHVIPVKKGLGGCVVPSKVYGIMAAGRPYLASCDAECDMARLAQEDRCGLWAPAGDVDAVRERLEWAIQNPSQVEAMASRGRAVAEARYDVRRVTERWRALFAKLFNGHVRNLRNHRG